MANQKISTLPAAAASATTDQKEVNQGGVSKRVTAAQDIALLATVAVQVQSLSVNGNLTVSAAGFIDGGGGNWNVDAATGGANFAQGNVSMLPGVTSVDAFADINTAGVYRVAITQVVGAQQPAIADADGTLPNITAQFNTLLAELRTHGLIAP